jgi:hypothetical protein
MDGIGIMASKDHREKMLSTRSIRPFSIKVWGLWGLPTGDGQKGRLVTNLKEAAAFVCNADCIRFFSKLRRGARTF